MTCKYGATAVLAILAAGLTAAPALATEATPPGASAGDGVFTADQSKRGEAVYNANCAMCHQPDLAAGQTRQPHTRSISRRNRLHPRRERLQIGRDRS
jgi:mono/diheme cytochrome c family protein